MMAGYPFFYSITDTETIISTDIDTHVILFSLNPTKLQTVFFTEGLYS